MAINLDVVHELQYKLQMAQKIIMDSETININLLNDIINQNAKIWEMEATIKDLHKQINKLQFEIMQNNMEKAIQKDILDNLNIDDIFNIN